MSPGQVSPIMGALRTPDTAIAVRESHGLASMEQADIDMSLATGKDAPDVVSEPLSVVSENIRHIREIIARSHHGDLATLGDSNAQQLVIALKIIGNSNSRGYIAAGVSNVYSRRPVHESGPGDDSYHLNQVVTGSSATTE